MTTGVRLLGPPSIRKADEWSVAPLDKRLALLTYLACSESWVTRERLAYLFWPDTTTASARINLRQLLARTRTLVPEAAIEADDKRLNWTGASDVREFRRAVRAGDWPAALSAYRGELSAGLVVDDASEFENWFEFERSQLREAHRQAALHQADFALAVGRSEEAAGLYELLLRQDPLDEGVMQELLRLLVQLGAVEEAGRRLQVFGSRLQAELGFAPSAATELLVASGGTLRMVTVEPPLQTVSEETARRPRLSAPLTSFVGRTSELAACIRELSSESCRLLTILGPGGIGKTRLALRAAQLLESHFTHGCVTVPLAQVTSVEALPMTLAAAVGLELRWLKTPLDQLIAFLAQREMLLVLDNFEHLIDGAMQVQQLLSESPKLKVLVTSRQRLRLQGEWLLPLVGLETPPLLPADQFHPDSVNDALAYDALVLLDERARQVEPGFTITQLSLSAAVSICRRLEGLPLGIELAAGWLRMLTLDEVMAALESSLDELESDARDTVERHRTLRATIDHSWNLLSPAEHRAARSLAVFHDGYDRTAARGVTGTSQPLLKALQEKSLLRLSEGGRYDSHQLILRYLQERLADQPDERQRLMDAHANHFLQLLASWSDRLHGPQQPTMLEQLAPDYANITTAWLRGIENGWMARCLAAIEPLVLFHGIQGRFAAGERVFAASLERLTPNFQKYDQGALLLASLKVNHAWFQAGMARFDEAAIDANAALELVAAQNYYPVKFRANSVLGSIALRRGDVTAARVNFEEALICAEELGDQWGIGLVAGQLGLLQLRSGNHQQARSYIERALAVNEAIRNTPGIVNDLDYLGQLSLATGDMEAAAQDFERGLALAEGSHFRLRVPYLKTQLATVKLALGQAPAAVKLATDALDVAEELGQRALQAEALTLLGQALVDEGERATCLTRALELAHSLSEAPRMLEVLFYLAQLPSHHDSASGLMRLVAEHPATRPTQRQKAAVLLEAADLRGASPDGSQLTLEETVRQLLAG